MHSFPSAASEHKKYASRMIGLSGDHPKEISPPDQAGERLTRVPLVPLAFTTNTSHTFTRVCRHPHVSPG